ncbi:MAG: SsrA-binding protein [Pseudohongiellaceae bacterium]|jgi:SsrA-binding protein
MSKKNPKQPSGTIALNKKAKHDFHLETKFEAGLVLQGWEVKSLRMGNVQIVDCYVHVRDGEAWLLNAHITPLNTVSTHYVTEPTRYRKLLLSKKELAKLHVAIQQDGRTCVCTALYWKKHLIKAEICIAQGKQQHDKRAEEKNRDWDREKHRIVRDNTKQ